MPNKPPQKLIRTITANIRFISGVLLVLTLSAQTVVAQTIIVKDSSLINGTTVVYAGKQYLKNGFHLDGIYVHKDFQRRTIGSKLLRIMESRVSVNGYEVLKSDTSITAFPFFDSHYYEVEKRQKKNYKGLAFEYVIVYREL